MIAFILPRKIAVRTEAIDLSWRWILLPVIPRGAPKWDQAGGYEKDDTILVGNEVIYITGWTTDATTRQDVGLLELDFASDATFLYMAGITTVSGMLII